MFLSKTAQTQKRKGKREGIARHVLFAQAGLTAELY